MKIAIWHNLPSGGGKRAFSYHVRGLLERGHRAEVWSPPVGDADFAPLGDAAVTHVVPLDMPPEPGPGPLALRRYWGHMRARLAAMDRHCQECARQINAGGFDVLLAHPCLHFRVTSLARFVDVPSVLYLQEPYRELYEALPRLPWLAPPDPPKAWWASPRGVNQFLWDLTVTRNHRIQARDELQNVSAYGTVLVNSRYSRESVLRTYGIDAKVCYLGVDAELFRPTGVPREKFVVGLGGIYVGKGLERAVAAVGAVPERQRPELVWVGNFVFPPYLDEVQREAKALGVRLVTKVRVPDAEVLDLLNRAALMVYTSRLEPFGFAPLEANACETPVVAIAEGGVRETVQHGTNGLLADDADPEALGLHIRTLLEDPGLARQMGTAARKNVVERWSWTAALERLEARLLDASKR